MVAIQKALEQIGRQYTGLLTGQTILEVCREVGHTFRDRLLGPIQTVWWFLVQVLHGNTACAALRHLMGQNVSDSAYCQARSRLSVKFFRTLLRRVTERLRRTSQTLGLWHGHRVFHLDGSSFSMPDTPALQAHFGQSGKQATGCGFPTAHLLALVDAAAGWIVDVVASPLRTHDLTKAASTHGYLRPGDVLVADRAFGTYAHVALLWQRGVHGVLRIHQAMITDFTPGRPHWQPGGGPGQKGRPRSRWLRSLGIDDQIVQWVKPKTTPRWMTRDDYAALPEVIRVRELQYRVTRRGYRPQQVRLVTTLLDAQVYSAEELADLYRCRWQVEVNLRHLKQTLGLDVLRCKTVAGVEKELLMFALAYNLVRAVMCDAAERQDAQPDWVSFIDALRWLCSGGEAIPLEGLRVIPLRPGRVEPRVVKRRPKPYKLMTKPRDELRNELTLQDVRA